jgi:hypothetical protein
MSKKSRTILFIVLFLCFALATPAILFYSWGYRLDFQTKRLVRTGAFYFKVLPKSAYINVSLPDKSVELTKKTDFFFGSALLENLLPKTYSIEIQKDGFYPWKKNLEIKENQVTEAKNIVLIPTDPGISLLNKNTTAFFPSIDGRFVILKETATSSAFALKLLDLQKNVKSHLINSQDISKNAGLSLIDLEFSSDAKIILLEVNDKANIKYFLLSLNQTVPKPELLDFLGKDVEQISFNPQNPQEIFVLQKANLYKADLTQKKLSLALAENVMTFQISNDNIYYLDDSGFLFKADLSLTRKEKINNLSFSLEKGKNYQIKPVGSAIFLSDGSKLFLFNPDSGSFESFFETKNEPNISPDSQKAVYYSDYEIWLLFLKHDPGQPPRETGQRLFLARFSEKINDVFWLTPDYLVFSVGGQIKIAETDDRDVINVVDLAELTSPYIFWNQPFEKLYILSQGNFYGTKQLLP